MADSIDPLQVTTTKKNIFVETTVTNATALWIQNTGNSAIYFAEKATEPASELGGIIYPGDQLRFDAASTGIWLWTKVSPSLATIQEA